MLKCFALVPSWRQETDFAEAVFRDSGLATPDSGPGGGDASALKSQPSKGGDFFLKTSRHTIQLAEQLPFYSVRTEFFE